MLKKILKGSILVAMIATMGSNVMAQGAVVHGFVASYFGQQNSGVDNTSAYMDHSFLGVFDISASSENISAGVEFDYIDVNNGTVDACMPRVEWKANESLKITVGSSDPDSAMGFSKGGGVIAPFVMGNYDDGQSYVRVKANGLHATYQISESMIADFGINDGDYINDASSVPAGSGMHVSLGATLDALAFKAAYENGTSDDPTISTDDALTSSGMLVGARYSLGESMSVSVDYSTKSIAVTKDTTTEYSSMALQIIGKNMGPGNVTVTFATETIKDSQDTTWTNLVYDYDIGEPGVKAQILYLGKTNTPKGGSSTSESFAGVGFIKFF